MADSDDGILGRFSAWLALLTVALYASGYMVVFSASERLGISDPGGDFFKYKYIQVGAYCDGFIACFASIGYVISSNPRKKPENKSRYTPSFESLITLIVVEIALIFQGIIVAPGTWALPWMLPMLAYLVLAVVAGVLGKFSEESGTKTKRTILKILIVLAALSILGCLVVRAGILVRASDWIPPELYRKSEQTTAILLLLLLCIYLGRLLYVVENLRSGPSQFYWYAILAPLIAFVTFDVVIGFAAAIYPLVPVAKGGASFTSAPQVDIFSSDGTQKKVSGGIILLETSTNLYVARDDAARANWGTLGSHALEHIRRIPLSSIGDIRYYPWDPVHQKPTRPSTRCAHSQTRPCN